MNKTTCRFLLVGLYSLIHVTSVYAFNPDNDPSLVGCWKLDETSGAIASDSSSNGNNGAVQGNPKWAAGKLKGALDLDGSGDYVDCGNSPVLNFQNAITVSAWVNIRSIPTAWMCAVAKGENAWRLSVNNTTPQFHFGITWWENAGAAVNGVVQVGYNEWHHLAGTFDGTDIDLYVDGVLDATTPGTSGMGSNALNLLIGENPESTGRYWDGLIDDVRLYNKALLPADLAVIISGLWDPIAEKPSPADEQTDVPREVVLTWKPGPYADTHDVYFGTAFEDVNNASRTAPGSALVSQGQDANTYDPPGRLDFGTTYYWRVDEVNDAPDNTIFKGNVWSFTAEPVSYPVTGVIATASGSSLPTTGPEKTIDGSGLNANDEHGVGAEDGWVSAKGGPQWIQYALPQVCRLDKMLVWNSNQALEGLFGFGARDVVIEYSLDGDMWTTLGTFEFAQATGLADYTANTTVDFGGTVAKFVKLTINSNWGGMFQQYGLSEVRLYSIPVRAREPNPAADSTDVHPQVAMSWRAGREADSHELYVGADPNTVADGAVTPVTLAQPQYDLAAELSRTYYWKVVEVNQTEDPSAWAGDLWSFSTADYVVVDDFESYTNDSPNRVFQTWIDGAGFSPDEFFPNGNPGNGSGSYAGYDPQLGDVMETTYFYGGKQSMPLSYDNDAGPRYSEAIHTFDPPQDWSKHSITTLTLFFRGDVNNVGAPVYVKINDMRVTYNNGTASTTSLVWKQWNIDLASVPAADLISVKTLTIGVGDGSAGGTGTILVDEVRLYATAPQIVVPADPGTTGMAGWYSMEGNVQDGSGNGNNGTLVGAPTYATSLAGLGTALRCNGITDCVDLGNKAAFNPAGSFSVALWANIGAWATDWNHVMVGNRGEDSIGWQVRRPNGNSLCFTTRGVGQDDMTSVMTPPRNEWIHVACVYDNAANTKAIYVNGTLDRVVTTNAGAKVAATTHNTYIGARANSGNTGREAFFTGMLDDVRIYNRVLSEAEIRYLAGDR